LGIDGIKRLRMLSSIAGKEKEVFFLKYIYIYIYTSEYKC
jgi:hypothetical protein